MYPTNEIEALRQRVAELEAEVARLTPLPPLAIGTVVSIVGRRTITEYDEETDMYQLDNMDTWYDRDELEIVEETE
jgi:hypothetical protein